MQIRSIYVCIRSVYVCIWSVYVCIRLSMSVSGPSMSASGPVISGSGLFMSGSGPYMSESGPFTAASVSFQINIRILIVKSFYNCYNNSNLSLDMYGEYVYIILLLYYDGKTLNNYVILVHACQEMRGRNRIQI